MDFEPTEQRGRRSSRWDVGQDVREEHRPEQKLKEDVAAAVEEWRRKNEREQERRSAPQHNPPFHGGEGRSRGANYAPDVLPPVNAIRQATVHAVKPFGFFVRIDGCRKHGLVHLSQISDHEICNKGDSDDMKVRALHEILSEGERLWVKVVQVKTEEDGQVKIGCSMKLVSQKDGTDLDPNGIKMEAQERSHKDGGGRQTSELGAVFNVMCPKCGGYGHLKSECYAKSSNGYELLPEEEDAPGPEAGAAHPGGARDSYGAQAGTASNPPGAGLPRDATTMAPMGRGRALTQPAWMSRGPEMGPGLRAGPLGLPGGTERVELSRGAVAGTEPVGDGHKGGDDELPATISSVQAALDILARYEKERKHKKKRKHGRHGKDGEDKDERRRRKEEKKEKKRRKKEAKREKKARKAEKKAKKRKEEEKAKDVDGRSQQDAGATARGRDEQWAEDARPADKPGKHPKKHGSSSSSSGGAGPSSSSSSSLDSSDGGDSD